MTVEEKSKKIERFCVARGYCSDCPLLGTDEMCYEDTTPEVINRNYELIFGNEDNAQTPAQVFKPNVERAILGMSPLNSNSNNDPAEDPIKPGYYNDSKITPFEVIDDWDLDFYLGNAVKYIKRAGKKKDNSRLQDLKKIREYVDQEIRKEEARV